MCVPTPVCLAKVRVAGSNPVVRSIVMSRDIGNGPNPQVGFGLLWFWGW